MGKQKKRHNVRKSDFYECWALLILSEMYPDRYRSLIRADKPDLQCDSIGIEVTIADDEKHLEAYENWVKAYRCKDAIKRKRYVERIEQLGEFFHGCVLEWHGGPSTENIIDAIKRKREKLHNGDIKSFAIDELFIFTRVWMDEITVDEIQDFFNKSNLLAIYNRIYIMDKESDLYVFGTNEYQKIDMDTPEQFERANRAKEMCEMEVLTKS